MGGTEVMADTEPTAPKAAEPEAKSGAGQTPAANDQNNAVYDVPVEISAVLGTAQIQVSQLLKMGRGAVLELDRKIGDPVDIYVNKSKVARGEVIVVEPDGTLADGARVRVQ